MRWGLVQERSVVSEFAPPTGLQKPCRECDPGSPGVRDRFRPRSSGTTRRNAEPFAFSAPNIDFFACFVMSNRLASADTLFSGTHGSGISTLETH